MSIITVKVGDSIQDAIDMAGDGDTVYLEAGTHVLPQPIDTDKKTEFTGATMRIHTALADGIRRALHTRPHALELPEIKSEIVMGWRR